MKTIVDVFDEIISMVNDNTFVHLVHRDNNLLS